VRRAVVAGAALALVVAAGALAGTSGALGGLALPGASGAGASPSPAAETGTPATTAEIVRQAMHTTAELDGTLGYEGEVPVLAGTAGMVTRLPDEGRVIRRNGILYELDGRFQPRLFYGSRPMWRPLGPGVSDGADVRQLEQNLKALGYAPKGMKVNRHWDAKTTRAVKRWQRATGRTRDGTIDGRDIAFLPGAIRVSAHKAPVGTAVGPGAPVLDATTAKRVVTLDISAGRQDLVEPGQAVIVELPDGTRVDGAVRSAGRVASPSENGGDPTVPVTIDLDPDATLPPIDAAPVTIEVVTVTHAGVLAVPVNALVALLEGGYAVEVRGADGTRRFEAVELGLFENGLVEVTGAGIAEGDDVVVPQ
jgi:peptidoglycan hydrolase-like protein with peptidoglycan-binding domain